MPTYRELLENHKKKVGHEAELFLIAALRKVDVSFRDRLEFLNFLSLTQINLPVRQSKIDNCSSLGYNALYAIVIIA